MNMKMCSTTEKSCCVTRCVKLMVLVIVGIAVLGWVVMQLWNWLIPEIFAGAHAVNYCQALGILLLSKILFGSFNCGCRGRMRHQHEGNMTSEEREHLKNRLTSRWSMWCCSSKHDDVATKDTPPRAE